MAVEETPMLVAIPERTVDIWVTAEIVREFPDALLWSPTQRSSPDLDLTAGIGPEGKLFVLENKAPYVADNRSPTYTIGVEQRQLYNYLRHPQLRDRTFYVLPCPPFDPSIVAPSTAGGHVPDPRMPLIPQAAHSRLGPTPAVNWFNVVRAIDLWNALWRTRVRSGEPFWRARTSPSFALRPLTKWIDPCNLSATNMTLAEFLQRLQDCEHREELHYRPSEGEFGPQDYEHMEAPFASTTIATLLPRTPENFPTWV